MEIPALLPPPPAENAGKAIIRKLAKAIVLTFTEYIMTYRTIARRQTTTPKSETPSIRAAATSIPPLISPPASG